MNRKRYLKYGNKIYEIEKISLYYWTAIVKDTGLSELEVQPELIFDVSFLKKFNIIHKCEDYSLKE